MKEASSKYEQTDIEMSVILVLVAINENVQAEMLKNMVLDPE